MTVRRGFATVGQRQLHYRFAAPPESRTSPAPLPVLCLHQTPNSSQVFVKFMTYLASDRPVFAVDTPGLGQSDRPENAPDIADYAAAMAGFLDEIGLPRVNVVGYHTGASIALELAALRPGGIAAAMLVGLALFDPGERDAFFAEPWPRPTRADGGHLLEEWQRSFRWQGPGQSDESVERGFIEKISAGPTAWWGARAVMRHDLEPRLREATAPLLIVNARDDLFDVTPRARAIRPDARFEDFPDYGFGIFEVIPARLADLARDHFDGAAC